MFLPFLPYFMPATLASLGPPFLALLGSLSLSGFLLPLPSLPLCIFIPMLASCSAPIRLPFSGGQQAGWQTLLGSKRYLSAA
ncbi:MAG: hypothetical protein IJK84_06285 [Bacteroidales bacterium]|nr:hypothetical protein [Bacteroidales bacterium]